MDHVSCIPIFTIHYVDNCIPLLSLWRFLDTFSMDVLSSLCLVGDMGNLSWKRLPWLDTNLLCVELPFDLVEYLVQFIIWEECGALEGSQVLDIKTI